MEFLENIRPQKFGPIQYLGIYDTVHSVYHVSLQQNAQYDTVS